MKCLQIVNAVVDDLDLLFHHRNPLGEIVVFSDFPGEVFQFGFGDRLLLIQFGVHVLGGFVAGIDGTDQGKSASDNSHDNRLCHSCTSHA